MKIAVICDGSSKGNGTYCGAGVVIMNAEDGAIMKEGKKYTGIGTNNYAEYKAMQFAVELVHDLLKDYPEHKIEKMILLSDSNLIINQLKGSYRIKQGDLRELNNDTRDAITRLEKTLGIKIELDQVGRDFLARADELSRQASLEGSVEGTKQKYPFLTKKE